MTRFLSTILLLPALVMGQAGAGELVRLHVDNGGNTYNVYMEMIVHAPPERVTAVLTDYKNIARLNPSITHSEVLPSTDGLTRVLTRMEGCVFFYCVEIERIEGVSVLDNGDLKAVIEPAEGGFKSGTAHWQVLDEGEHSRVIYSAALEPDFWIPELIGPSVVRANLGEEIRTSFRHLEYYAQFPPMAENIPPPPEETTWDIFDD